MGSEREIEMQDMIEKIAECIWQSEAIRASGQPRRVDWSDVSDEDRRKYLFTATNVYYLVKA